MQQKYLQFCQVFWAWKINNIHEYKVARDVISCQVSRTLRLEIFQIEGGIEPVI
jgi:hypothetical protein